MRVVEEYLDRMQAELARLLLEQNGIRVATSGGAIGTLEGFPSGMHGTKLLVDDADYERARELLASAPG